MKPFMIIGKYSSKLIEEQIDSFHFEKYKQNQFEIDAMEKKDYFRQIFVFSPVDYILLVCPPTYNITRMSFFIVLVFCIGYLSEFFPLNFP